MNEPTNQPAQIHDLEHLTLGQAAKIAPGRPSTNCMWRWCRRGVLARTGQRIRLQHIRVGGKIFTTPEWLAAFGHQLAAADQVHFDQRIETGDRIPPRDPRFDSPKRRGRRARRCRDRKRDTGRLRQIEQELDQAGL